MARERQTVGGITPQALSQSNISGSESVMSAYSKIMGDRGYDPQQELEDAAKRRFDDFMEKARRGEVQGKGAYSKRFAPTAMGFQEYLNEDAGYQLDQSPRGAMAQQQRGMGYNRYSAM